MPKERRDQRSSFDQSRPSPYPSNSKKADENKVETQSLQIEDEKEWREARCPACLEHPHNAVLLICSSYEKGCRPYMCDTSSRHSNCLDQFLKSTGNVCPLCRGKISRRVVAEPARKFMNSKTRSCSTERCDFVGNYSELSKHARHEHPHERPTVINPTRQLDWERSEGETTFMEDFLGFSDIRDESAFYYLESASASSYHHGMRFSTTVPNDPDTHDDIKPTNKLKNSSLTLKDIVEQDVRDNKVMIYMKGDPELPRCRFSSLAVRVLKEYGIPLSSRDILEDPELKNAVKSFR